MGRDNHFPSVWVLSLARRQAQNAWEGKVGEKKKMMGVLKHRVVTKDTQTVSRIHPGTRGGGGVLGALRPRKEKSSDIEEARKKPIHDSGVLWGREKKRGLLRHAGERLR